VPSSKIALYVKYSASLFDRSALAYFLNHPVFSVRKPHSAVIALIR